MRDLLEIGRSGLDSQSLFHLVDALSLPLAAAASTLGLSHTKLLVMEGRLELLYPETSDRLIRLASIGALALDVLGAPTDAGKWLSAPNNELNGCMPLALVATSAGTQAVEALLCSLRGSAAPWHPSPAALERGRATLRDVISQPQNLTPSKFAALAGVSEEEVLKDIRNRRLLALGTSEKELRLPDWQLDPLALRLTQSVLEQASDVDTWTLYRALCEPLELFEGRTPAEAVTAQSIEYVTKAVLHVLGFRV
ncbi:MAG TPA: antitoxin Xre/MbcA/ParS toxin-binding domain-containing protein [Burkholderiales bacterium]|nr:antitoxin Xre/MbcA/ParS toxin-binding domain-containing protein [Burkholderiales bacterium]